MTAPLVWASRDRGMDVLVLDSPRNRNALSVRLLTELVEQVRRSAVAGARALVLDHTGPVFCAGVDLKERRAAGPGTSTHSTLLAALLRALWDYPGPVLCRVDGPVRGGGMGLLACADVVVAAERADFAYSEVRVGVAPALVAAVTLPKVPLAPLLPWLLTGEAFDATTAHRLGLVSRVARVADGPVSLEPEVSGVLRGGPDAARTVKRLARRLAGAELGRTLAEMEDLSAALFAGPEAAEGMAAFAEGRPPAWVPSAPAGS
ncbi:MAG TPA: enoyl-CoA hydratase-related protein [Mycobacteriales bacterium]|nr:enoyl-CoA hydratase-related protein [Mycobacteriales bacterium]